MNATQADPGSNADPKADPKADAKSQDAFPFPTKDKHDNPPEQLEPVVEETSEQALDHGVEESFPASDPVSVTVTKVEPEKKK